VNKKRRRQSDIAYEQLKKLIVHLELAPGTLIDEAEMMQRLGVGRTPLREALQHLAQENLVEIIPRRGIFVAKVTASDLTHVLELRLQFEGLAARLAAERATPAQISALEDFLSDARSGQASDDLRWNLETDRRFHQLVAEAAGNPFLQQILDRLYNLGIRLLYLAQVRMTFIEEEVARYQHVVDAIKQSNGEEAERAMKEHLDLTPNARVAP
jgi:DNA-binding GntR family transcriptional regulator